MYTSGLQIVAQEIMWTGLEDMRTVSEPEEIKWPSFFYIGAGNLSYHMPSTLLLYMLPVRKEIRFTNRQKIAIFDQIWPIFHRNNNFVTIKRPYLEEAQQVAPMYQFLCTLIQK